MRRQRGSETFSEVDNVSLAIDEGIPNSGGGSGREKDKEKYRMNISRIGGWQEVREKEWPRVSQVAIGASGRHFRRRDSKEEQ